MGLPKVYGGIGFGYGPISCGCRLGLACFMSDKRPYVTIL